MMTPEEKEQADRDALAAARLAVEAEKAKEKEEKAAENQKYIDTLVSINRKIEKAENKVKSTTEDAKEAKKELDNLHVFLSNTIKKIDEHLPLFDGPEKRHVDDVEVPEAAAEAAESEPVDPSKGWRLLSTFVLMEDYGLSQEGYDLLTVNAIDTMGELFDFFSGDSSISSLGEASEETRQSLLGSFGKFDEERQKTERVLEEWKGKPIHDLVKHCGLPPGMADKLTGNGVYTIGELVSLADRNQVSSIPGLGEKAHKKIVAALEMSFTFLQASGGSPEPTN